MTACTDSTVERNSFDDPSRDMIDMQEVSFAYGDDSFKLEIPRLTVQRGEKIAVIGPSGVGKTSFLKLVAGILLPQQGVIRVGDCSVNHLSDAQRRNFRISRIGIIFQDFQLLDYLNTRDNILHPFRISRALKLTGSVRSRADSLAQQLGIFTKMQQLTQTLSQGEKQRVAICRAMLPQPDLILADEATGNLDPANKLKILEALFRSVDSHQATLIAVTHDHELLNRFDRVIDFHIYCQEEMPS